jgi:dihydroorotate dehydrogenase (NAD+) catalytic subunit
VGLQNPGVEAYCAEVLAPLREVAPDLPVIANVCSHTVEDFAPVIDRLEREPQVVAYELNISCPNLDCGGMSFGTDPKQAAKVVAACRAATRRPLVVKLTPNVTDITEVARAVEAAGADALSMINTVTGMRIDVKTRRPVLARGFGGLSGPAVHPIAVYAVYRCRQATQLPIIGMGGVAEAQDAVELMLAGASMVAVGSASFRDPCAIPAVLDGLEAWCEANGVARLQDIVGTVRM